MGVATVGSPLSLGKETYGAHRMSHPRSLPNLPHTTIPGKTTS